MPKQKDISDADIELFRHSIGPVHKVRNRTPVTSRRKPSVARTTTKLKETRVHPSGHSPPDPVGMGDILSFRRPGVQKRVLNRLGKGQLTVEEELDLHGMNAVPARKKLFSFLDYCVSEGIRCIRIIHGKGRGSRDNKPVIKNMLNDLLREHENVLAFTSAPLKDGGSGAVYVLLKRQGENNVDNN